MSEEIETKPCSDGKCPNLVDGRMFEVFHLFGSIMGGKPALISFLDSKGYDVNTNIHCQPGKAICVKKRK